jgi:cysteinyl-tRNA synthetase
MALDLLGEGFDLHGGGIDLAFPHHENERAQAVGVGRAFACHWVHNGLVEVAGEKMSKSLGNFTSLTDLLERFDPRSFRLLVLQSHYRSPMEVTESTVGQAERAVERLDDMARRFVLGETPTDDTVEQSLRRGADREAVESFVARMDDDLDTPSAMAGVFDLAHRAHQAADAGNDEEGRRLAATAAVLCGALGLSLRVVSDGVDDVSAELVAERDAARAAGDWDRADAIRRTLEDNGWIVEDTPGGTRLHRRSGP